MQWVRAFLEWDQDRWLSRTVGEGMKDMMAPAVEGHPAYAGCQAALHDDLLQSCRELWEPMDQWMSARVVDDEDSSASHGLPSGEIQGDHG